VNLGLVHAEATQFMETNGELFDFVILNELLDDMPCRAYFADAGGAVSELVPAAREEDGRWTVRVTAEEAADVPADVPPGTITATSPEWVALVTGCARSLRPGGMLLVHDYGFAEPFTSAGKYAELPGTLPSFADMDYSAGAGPEFPRGFFRVFGNEEQRVLQITNDVNFAELAAALEPSGPVFAIPQGSSIINAGKEPAQGDGVFLAEFGLLEPGDDLPALLSRLRAEQARYRDEYAAAYTGGRGNVFMDLVFLRS
jgi:hypothetical protein